MGQIIGKTGVGEMGVGEMGTNRYLCPKSENFWKLWLKRAESSFSEKRPPRARFSHFQKS